MRSPSTHLRSGTTFSCTGGAALEFELSDRDLESLIARAGHAVGERTDRAPTASYRRVIDPDGSMRYERHDHRRDPVAEAVGSTIDELVDDLHLTIALHAVDEVFVHAGVVAWNDRAILLPGRSHAGKSTLVHALLDAGATYLSDEYARITADGRIAPYPRPIHLRTPTGRRLIDPNDLGDVAETPVSPGLLVFTRYAATGEFRPRPVSPGQAALELLDNTVIADLEPERASAAVATVARVARAIRSERADAASAAAHILTLADAQEVS